MGFNDTGLDRCPLCRLDREDGGHLFIKCPVARGLWLQSTWPVDVLILPPHTLTSFTRLFLQPHRLLNVPREDARYVALNVALVVDSLWFWRNKVVHQNEEVVLVYLIRFFHRRYSAHLLALRTSVSSYCTGCRRLFRVNIGAMLMFPFGIRWLF